VTTVPPKRSTARIAASAIPAAVLGTFSGLALIGLSALAGQLEHVLWDWLPGELGTSGDNRWWIKPYEERLDPAQSMPGGINDARAHARDAERHPVPIA